ncbi:MAG: FAD-dependent oxidoreductase [Proteobacteria bacterium]|nr:FAD-dependent oxidoreductase [Pseudomonadota bacterium]
MAFLPFFSPSATPPKLVIVGGGYAGMAALISFYRHCPNAEVSLVDPRLDHFKITHLHEQFRQTSTKLKVPFEVLEQRFGFRHVSAAVEYDDDTLLQWQSDRYITVGDEQLSFDYLLLALGTKIEKLQSSDQTIDLNDLSGEAFPEVIERLSALQDSRIPISVVGGGPTGIQFLFEIAHWLKSANRQNPLRLIDALDDVLTQFKPDLANYVRAGMLELGIEFVPNSLFQSQDGESILIENKLTGESAKLASGLTFIFAGKRSAMALEANAFGQVMLGRTTLSRIFAAGDCSRYRSIGSNTPTAQSAVRKGKVCARNILRHSGKLKIMEPYIHQDLGYVISLGPRDAIGWIGLQANVVAGAPAVVVKELVEAQHELLLAGIDTYLI